MIEMNLVPEGSEILLQQCQEFDFANPPFDPKEFAESLYEAMKKHDGLGLSANQVGYPYRVFAVRTDEKPLVIFNPRIVDQSDNLISMKEGCLSFPLLYLNVKRPDRIRVRFQYYDGQTATQQFIGMTARIVLHEYDHMEGKVFTQKASAYEKDRALRKRMILKRKVNKVSNGKR
jgi:peptide deformylase